MSDKERIKLLEADLAQCRNHFHLLFDAIVDSVFVFEVLPNGRRGLIRDVNKGACNRLGYTKEEFLKMTVEEFSTTESELPIPSVDEIFSQKEIKLFELIHTAKDGKKFPVEVSARKFNYNGTPMILSIVRDISVRKDAEKIQKTYLKQLEAEVAERMSDINIVNEQYRAFFEDNHSVMYILDTENAKVLDTNKAAVEYYGYTREQLLNMKISDINNLSQEQLSKTIKEITENKISRIIGKHQLASGEIRNVEIFSGPFEVNGKTKLISIIHDISERLENEKALSEAKEAAESANKAKDEFLANISHEVRTPLNGVMGMLQLLQVAKLNEEQQSYVTTALQSSRNLLKVLNDVLDFTKIEAGKMELYNEKFELTELIKQCLELFKIQAEDKNLQLIADIDQNTPNFYIGDEGRIRQILFNLIGNSIKFTESGSITISVFSLPHNAPNMHRVFFAVEDTGSGIPDDKIKYIFDSFTQVDGSLSRKYQGAGLGLSIVKRLVNLIGGTISILSEVGVGTTIIFCVYLESCEPPSLQQKNKLEEEFKSHNLNILLVEDEKVNILLARKFLEKIGHQVICAENGEIALEKLRKHSFDAILMDIQMPVMNGLEATRLIRSSKEFNKIKSIPIIALTAHATNKDINIAMQAGMNGYISKPFEWELLKKTIHKVINKL